MSDYAMKEHMRERFGKVSNFCENPPMPKSLNIELNNQCNHKCVFCSYHGKYAVNPPKPSYIPLEVVKKLLDEAKRLGIGKKELGLYFIGEVFLYKDLAEVVRYAKGLGFPYVFITTNGALATPANMKAVLDAGLDSIRFSINAVDRSSYADIHGRDDFDKVCDNLAFMHEYISTNTLKVSTSISCVVTKNNLNIREEFENKFGRYVDEIIFIPILFEGLTCDEKFIEDNQVVDDANTQINPDFICPLLFDTMYITANLEVMPCCYAPYYDTGVFYDLKRNLDLEKAWNCDTFKQYRNMFLNKESDEGTICKGCVNRKLGADRFFMQ
jgi:MoaA/NifB/PqqE/SkfB family radical SAM enzyme